MRIGWGARSLPRTSASRKTRPFLAAARFPVSLRVSSAMRSLTPGSEMRPVESGSDAVAGAGCCDDGVGAGGEHADWVRLRRFDPCRPADFAGEVEVDD